MTAQSVEASFHGTQEGTLGARVGNLAFLALPTKDHGLRIAYAPGLETPPERWARRDFDGLGRLFDGEAGFRAYVEERAEHRRQLAGLPRASSLDMFVKSASGIGSDLIKKSQLLESVAWAPAVGCDFLELSMTRRRR